MRVRIKFSKTGSLKYIGHLDVMRFFQKAVRRAGLDVVYSEGFSPHMLMSFAQPLGVGLTSEAEYFDIDLKTSPASETIVRLLNVQMPDEMRVMSAVEIPSDKANKCMSLVAAAAYEVCAEGYDMAAHKKQFEAFIKRDKIEVVKKTKKSETLTDIKPFIFSCSLSGETVSLVLSAGSVNNLKPGLVFEAYFRDNGIEPDEVCLRVHRKELYAEKDGGFVPLGELGKEIA